MKRELYQPQLHKLIPEWISLLWQQLGTVVILSALGFFGSIPIVTAGALLIGIFNMMKLVVNGELALKEDFTLAVKAKWKTATALFLMNLVIAGIIAFDLYFFWQNPQLKLFFWVGIYFAIIYLMSLTYMFPMLADENVGLKKIFVRSFKMAMVDPGFSFVVMLISVLWIALCFILIPMLATLAIGGLALWGSLAYREMSLKVDSLLALKETNESEKNRE